MPFTLPIQQSMVGAHGAAAGSPVTVSGLKANDVILSIVRWKVGEQAAPVDPSTFVVSDGAIESASVSTEGYFLSVVWTR